MVEIEIKKRHIIAFAITFSILALAMVYAYGTNNPVVFGHSGEEIDLTGLLSCTTPGKILSVGQNNKIECISAPTLNIPTCSPGQILVYSYTNGQWQCRKEQALAITRQYITSTPFESAQEFEYSNTIEAVIYGKANANTVQIRGGASSTANTLLATEYPLNGQLVAIPFTITIPPSATNTDNKIHILSISGLSTTSPDRISISLAGRKKET